VRDYHINDFWSDEDGWVADIPDLKFCSAQGDTPQQAVVEVLEAKEAWLESARAHGDPIPPPLYRPAIYARPVDVGARRASPSSGTPVRPPG
jgi:predicted RNase H-like HicB family nuclease